MDRVNAAAPMLETVWVAAQGAKVGPRVAGALTTMGVRVALIADAPSDQFDVVHTEFSSRSAVAGAFAEAARRTGSPQLVVITAMPESASAPRALIEIDQSTWQASCHAIIRTTLYCLQAALPQFIGPATIVVLGPSFTFSGAAALVPLSTASEAQRALVKSAARQWGAREISVNWVAAHAEQLDADFAGGRLPFRPERVPVARGRALDLESEVMPIIAHLASPSGRKITGASLCLDGGEWMLP